MPQNRYSKLRNLVRQATLGTVLAGRIDLAQGPCGRLRPWERIMEGFVIRQNIEHYRAMLKVTTDLERRRVMEKLL